MNARWTKRLIAPLACAFLAACGAPVQDSPDDSEPSKSELAERLADGKADHMVDWCEKFDWYDDGICDDFCVNPDPDCATDDYAPCGGLTCGESCSVCDPNDPDCYETAVLKECQPDGTCSAAVAECGDDDTNNDNGSYDPCGGLTCGETCTSCDPTDPDCFETAVVKMCQADGTCSATVPECDGGDHDDAYNPCEGLTCGESCSTCDPADPDCYETAVLKYCQADGSCSGIEPASCTAEYDPCDGKTCGNPCSLCDPNDPDCFETLELKVCNPEGVCVSETTSATCN